LLENRKAVILNDTSNEFHHGCETVISNIKSLLRKNGIDTIGTNYTGVNWKTNTAFLESVSKVDIVLVNGEGTLHHAQQRAKELIVIGKYVKEKFKIPVVLINSTYQENGTEIAEYLRYFDLIYVRETLSQEDIKKYGIDSRVVPDMTFYSKYDLSGKKENGKTGYTDSVYQKTSVLLYEKCMESKSVYMPALTNIKLKTTDLITFLKVVKFHVFRAVNFVFWKLGLKISYHALRQFYFTKDYNRYIDKIAKLNFIVTGRYHSLCFTLKTLTPFVAIKSNSHKIEGMLDDIGIGDTRIKEIEKEKVFDVVKFEDEERLKIKEYIDSAPIKIENMFKEIKNLLR